MFAVGCSFAAVIQATGRHLRLLIFCLGLVSLLIVFTLKENHDTKNNGQKMQQRASKRSDTIPSLELSHFRLEGKLLRELIHKGMNAARHPKFHLKDGEKNGKIPKIIHQLWKDVNIPQNTKVWVEKWEKTNTNWTYMFWTDQSARDFVSQYFPALLETYDGYRHPVQKADMFRYIVLFAFGGVYADIDIEPLKSLEPIRAWAPCIIPSEPDVHVHVSARLANHDTNYTLACNAFMACQPHHPFMFFLIRILLKDFEKRSKHRARSMDKCPLEETIACTGPKLLSEALAFYRRSYGDLFREYPDEDVMNTPAKYFLPTFAQHVVPRLKQICFSMKLNLDKSGVGICEALRKSNFSQNVITNESFTNHHWYDSYHFNGRRRTVPLMSVLPKAVLFPNVSFSISWKNPM